MSEHDDTTQPARKRPTGRRVGDSGTREAILDAALTLFSEHGYDGASMRAIAGAAGVDPALIRHFFGDKETLFVTTVSDRTAIPERLVGVLRGDPKQLGHRVTDAYLRLWDTDDTRPILLALVRSATTSDRAAEMLREVLGTRARDQTGVNLADVQMRGFVLAASHLFGVAVTRHVIRLPAIAAMDHDDLVAAIAPTVQRYLATTDL